MSTDLSGRVALVTGAGTGIGLGVARAFASAGATVAVTGRRADVLERAVARIEAEGGRACALPSDVTDVDALKAAVDAFVADTGRLDIVVANAGNSPAPGPVLEMEPAEWRRIIDLNLTGAWNTAYVCVPHLLSTGGGHLLMMGSAASRSRNAETVGAYGAAKAGLHQLTRVIASDLSTSNIAVNEITPGLVPTEGLGAIEGETSEFLLAAAEMMGDWLKEPEEIGRLALYLVSLPTNGTTGQSFQLDRNR
jgi:3-oxoacyl-[acyl-carrier protein] reductase